MRILVDSSNYFVDNDNLGDRATFQVLARRLLGLWPDAQIRFITGNRRLIEQTHPALRPVVLAARNWIEEGPELESYVAEVDAADLVLATGGGYFSDAFADHALGVLNTLDVASQLGKPAVMMGAGFEPLCEDVLQAAACSVLPRLALIACREGAIGPDYLRSLGVQPSRMLVSGDDTVELAYEARRAELGRAIGVNVRQAPYAGVDDACLTTIRSVLEDVEKRFRAPLVPIPVSLHGPSDLASIAKVVRPVREQLFRASQVRAPHELLDLISRCRLVVTGSYHAAVFALSQGIPVVAITDSLHYKTKMGGLASQFGTACTPLTVGEKGFREDLAEAIGRAWESAEDVRRGLLNAAVDQIAAGHAAYQRLPGLLRPRASVRHFASPNATLRTLWQREVDEIAAGIRKRDETIREQVAALADMREVLDARTAWAKRMVLEAERRGDVITELHAAVEERSDLIQRLSHELERRDAETRSRRVGPSVVQNLISFLVALLPVLRMLRWRLTGSRVTPAPPSRRT